MNDTEVETPKLRVLIADDDASTRMIVKRVLERDGFQVIQAPDGEAALECFEQTNPDIVLLDVKMPRLDGFSVCRRIRATEAAKMTPICMVTGLDDAESVDQAYDAGATDFLSKPIAWPVLGYRLRYLLRANGALNELRGLVAALPDSVFVLDMNGRPHAATPDFDLSASKRGGDAHRMDFEEFVAGADKDEIRTRIRDALESGEQQAFEHKPDGTSMHVEIRFVARDQHSVLAIARDITERKRAESRIHDLAFYDHLTGLPNRQLFSLQLNDMIDGSADGQAHVAILFLDLDHFKRINDTMGHSTGDELLKTVATRLQSCVRTADRVFPARPDDPQPPNVARLGGDEFVVVLHGVDCEDNAASIATRIIDALAEPIQCAGHQFVVTPSIGIAMYPQDGASSNELLTNADAAMYRAKLAGRNTYSFFSGTMKVRSLKRLDLENELRHAISEQRFELHYQPKVNIATWTIVGAEALLRWPHESRGWISPAEFIPVAEDTGLILPLGRWVLNRACEQIAEWQRAGLSAIPIAVNISSQQMYATDLVDVVAHALADNRVRPNLLELELTESLLIEDTETTIDTLNMLRGVGVRVSVDDFGTGYSSLSYLKRFPIDTLKIDRSFVRDLHHDKDDAAICAAILAMSRQLDLSVVAEGVELEEQLEFLRQHDCQQIQGFLFSKPLPPDEFAVLLAAHNPPDEAGVEKAS